MISVSSSLRKAVKSPPGLNTTDSIGMGYFDGYRRKRNPYAHELVNQYKRTVYALANLNATGVSRTPLRLYMRKEKNATPTLLRRGIETKAVSSQKINYLQSLEPLRKTLRSFVDIEEVIIHPAIDLLQRGNSLAFFNGERLNYVGQLSQEIMGREYWLVTNNILGVPDGLWLLPTQYVEPKQHRNGTRKVIDFYRYYPPSSGGHLDYKPEDIISFLMPSLRNPYVDGVSPLEASFDVNEISNKMVSLEGNILTNEGRPDILMTPKVDSSIDDVGAKRFERQYATRFARGRSGGIMVLDETMEVHPLNFNPRDLARLEIHKTSNNELANSFGVPYALIAEASHNRQQLEAAEVQHAKYGIRPRLDRRVCVLNDQYLTRFDISGNLFFAYDDPVPENDEAKQKKIVNYVSNGIWTKNEGRKEDGTYGEHADPEADKLQAMNVPGDTERMKSRGDEKDGDEKE